MGAIHSENFKEEMYKVVNKGIFRSSYLRTNKPYSDDKTETTYEFYNKKHIRIVSFRARPLPGCCGVLVVYYLRPDGMKKAIDIFKNTLDLIKLAAKNAQFGAIILTQVFDSIGHEALLNQQTSYFPFRNGKTHRNVSAFFIDLKQPEPIKVKKFEEE